MEYAFNFDYISTVLCVNKEKPKLNCNGQCYLAKMLAENEDNNPDKGIPIAQLDVMFTPLYFQESLHVVFANIQRNWEKTNIAFLKSEYSFTFTEHPFKPPISKLSTSFV
ncbi:hypothetical protein [Allomuricauda sp. F6463D]|uniref:hypothetical protein n=1 Tax=Allomuricauda sp. F6463D TaxID=2926409 RepID=UPI001FF6D369|nr:hypothetical protein [Muricauda sp. F6463D]MCK0160966.1 hypothetical protein [Muricauda sp. F6463D]